MHTHEHEMAQFEALGQLGQSQLDALTRTWTPPHSPPEAPAGFERSSMSDLEQLKLPADGWSPRLA